MLSAVKIAKTSEQDQPQLSAAEIYDQLLEMQSVLRTKIAMDEPDLDEIKLACLIFVATMLISIAEMPGDHTECMPVIIDMVRLCGKNLSELAQFSDGYKFNFRSVAVINHNLKVAHALSQDGVELDINLLNLRLEAVCLAPGDKVDEVQYLLSQGADINWQDENKRTCLSFALISNNNKIAEFLIKSGVKINVATKVEGLTPLHIAAKKLNVPIVKLLLEAGADSNAKDYVHQQDPLAHACEMADINATLDAFLSFPKVKLAIHHLGVLTMSGSEYGMGLLLQHNIKIPSDILKRINISLKLLLKASLRTLSYGQMTEIFMSGYSVNENDRALVKFAVRKGDVELINILKRFKATFIFDELKDLVELIKDADQRQVVLKLITPPTPKREKKQKPRIEVQQAHTASQVVTIPAVVMPSPAPSCSLHEACTNGRANVVRDFLLNMSMAELNEVHDGRTPLMTAIEHGHVDVVRELLSSPLINVNASDVNGNTASHLACETGQHEVVEALIKTGRVDFTIQNNKHMTPMMVAIGKEQTLILWLLINSKQIDWLFEPHYNKKDFLHWHKHKQLQMKITDEADTVRRPTPVVVAPTPLIATAPVPRSRFLGILFPEDPAAREEDKVEISPREFLL